MYTWLTFLLNTYAKFNKVWSTKIRREMKRNKKTKNYYFLFYVIVQRKCIFSHVCMCWIVRNVNWHRFIWFKLNIDWCIKLFHIFFLYYKNSYGCCWCCYCGCYLFCRNIFHFFFLYIHSFSLFYSFVLFFFLLLYCGFIL